MKIEPNKYLKRSLTQLYFKQGRRVLNDLCQPILDLSEYADVETLKSRVQMLLKGDPVDKYLMEVWQKGGSQFAVDTIKRVHRVQRKQEMDVDYWEDYFRRYVNERSLLVTGQILTTQEVIINNLIDQVLEEGYSNGLGIAEIQRTMRSKLTEGLTVINKYQAERIARTETGKASNSGSWEGARETGVDMKKYWINSGRKNSRDSHVRYSQMSPVEMSYQYNSGLKYPCDPDCGIAGEVINCGCATGWWVD